MPSCRHSVLIIVNLLVNYYNVLSIGLWWTSDAAKPPSSSLGHHRLVMQDRAILHLNLMNTVGHCREPRPLVVYPAATANKIYYPRGTLVYRCTDQTGCCPNPGELCRPETVETIEKVFFVNHFIFGQKVSTGQRMAPRWKGFKSNFTTMTETLTFVNHTSCKCIRLAPDAIEHDDVQSVVSRPINLNTWTLMDNASLKYHLIIASTSFLATMFILFFIYKYFACFDLIRRQRILRRRNAQLV